MLYEKQHRDPPPLGAGAEIPEELAALCLRLLARDSAQRPDPVEIARSIAAQRSNDRLAPCRRLRSPSLLGLPAGLSVTQMQPMQTLLRK